MVTGKDEFTIPTAHASNRENENDVIPETQDAELQAIEVTEVSLYYCILFYTIHISDFS